MSNKITPENAGEIKKPLDGPTKRLLLERARRPYCCETCGNDGSWQGQKLRLQVDHVDGNPTENDPSNLRYLCPNCHSQTPTHSFKGRKHTAETRQKIAFKAAKPRPQQRSKG